MASSCSIGLNLSNLHTWKLGNRLHNNCGTLRFRNFVEQPGTLMNWHYANQYALQILPPSGAKWKHGVKERGTKPSIRVCGVDALDLLTVPLKP